MRKILHILLFLAVPFNSILSQGTAGDQAKYEYRFLVDMPTAGILEKGNVGIINDILAGGVLISKIEVGIFDNVSIGISYGGSNIIGSGNPDWYKLPAANLRVRVFTETILMPSITLGFDSQGKGHYFSSADRYAIKSPGLFAAASKNFALLGFFSVHGSINYSLEGNDGDNFINLMGGVEKTIGPNISLIADYDFTFNDDNTRGFGIGNGYLNAGIRWALGDGFTLGFDLRDLLKNRRWNPNRADRALRIEYIKSIF